MASTPTAEFVDMRASVAPATLASSSRRRRSTSRARRFDVTFRRASSSEDAETSSSAARTARGAPTTSIGTSTPSALALEVVELSGRTPRARWSASEKNAGISRGRPLDAATGAEDTSVVPELRRIFLPSGFPATVSADYVDWLRWQLVSLLFRDILEIMSAQSLLVALGMGSTPGALPLTAAAKWVLKDGVGSVATLLAGSFGGQKYDEDPKRWWGLTNALEDVARAIELVTPAAPGLFLPLAASAVFVRSAALTGRGSLLNGTFMQHFGRNNNLGDIRAKLEVQGRWLALIALPTGIQVFQLVSAAAADFVDDGDELSAFIAAAAIYGIVIGVHVFACWQAAKSLRFDSLNRFRLLTLAEMFVANEDEELPDCVVVGEIEGVYKPRRTAQTPTFGASPSEIGRAWDDFTQAVVAAKGRPYVLGWDPKRDDVAAALLLDAATPRDTLAAALACQKLRVDGSRAHAYEYADAKVANFEAGLLRSGWKVDFIQLGTAPTFALSASEKTRDDDSTTSPR